MRKNPVQIAYRKSFGGASLVRSGLIAIFCVISGIILSLYGLRLEGGAVAVLGLAPLYLSLDRKLMPALPFGPCTFAYLPHMLGFGLGPLGQRYLIETERFFEDGFVQGQWGAVMGLATFAIIYFTAFSKTRKHHAANETFMLISKSQWAKYSVVLLFVATLIVVVGFETGTFRRLGQVAEVSAGIATLSAAFQQTPTVVFFFLAFCGAHFGRKWVLLWLGAFTTYALLFTLDGTRGPVVMSLLISTIGAIAGGALRKRIFLALCLFLIFLFPMADIVNEYRTIFRDVESLGERFQGFSTSVDIYANKYREGSTGWFTTVLDHSTAHTVDKVFRLTPGAIPFAGFSELDRLSYLYIPRAIAPNRRDLHDGNDIAVRYDPFAGKVNNYTPAVADGYRRWGWVGIPIIYTLQGLIFGAILGFLSRKQDRPKQMAMTVFMILSAYEVWSNTFLGTIYFLGWTIPKYYAFFWFLGWVNQKFSPPARSVI